jgi:hypothetical protein
MMPTGKAPAVTAGKARGSVDVNAEAADLSRQYGLGNCTSSWLETSYLTRVVTGWIVVAIALITLITLLLSAHRSTGLAGLGLIALPCGGLLIWLRPRSRRVRLYLFEGGTARVANAGPGPRLAVLPWADLSKVKPSFDVDHDLIRCELRGHSGTKLMLGRHDGTAAPQAIMQAAERVLAGRPPGA